MGKRRAADKIAHTWSRYWYVTYYGGYKTSTRSQFRYLRKHTDAYINLAILAYPTKPRAFWDYEQQNPPGDLVEQYHVDFTELCREALRDTT